MVAALGSGDAHSLSAVHDRYAARLYDYAFGMLRDREAAEDAVHDALLVAIGRVGALREPHRITVWLYALTRNECLRQSRRSRMASRPKVADSRDETVFFGADLQAEQARAWIRDAAAGLEPHRREALDLTVRHGIVEADLATVLGVTPKRAAARVAAARRDLDKALDSLLTARAGHGACPELDALLAGWDGLFTRSVHERVSGHTATCRTCAGAPPRGGAADRFAELPPAPAPALLRNRLLGTAAVPDRVAYRGDVAEPFLRSGFPVPLEGAGRRRRAMIWAAVAVVVLALVGGALYLTRSGSDARRERTVGSWTGTDPVDSGSPRSSSTEVATSPTASGSASPSASPSGTPTPSAWPSSRPSPAPTPTGPGAGSDPSTKVNAFLTDATLGCPERWRATATGYIRGNEVRKVTFYWGESSPSRPVRLARMGDGIYQAAVEGLPMDVPVYWRVVAITRTGLTSSTGVKTAQHRRQC